jgi:tetratricopeptide (TPR) repeat protein
VAVHSSQEGLARFERARELAVLGEGDDGALSRLFEKEGDVLLRLGRFDEAHERWEQALATAPAEEAPHRIADLRRKLGDVLVENGYLSAAIDQYKAGIALCGSEPSAAAARLYGESAWLYLARGDHMLAVYAAERAVGVTAQLGEPRAASRAHAIFGRVFGRLGDPARARDQLDQAVGLARQADPFEELRALRSLADHVDGAESRSDEAVALYEQALDLAERIADVPAQLDLRAALGQLAVERADWATAERLADESARLVEREGLTDRSALPLALTGALAWRGGDLDAAEAQLAAAVETATRIRWWRVAALANWWFGTVMRERERPADAAALLEEAALCGQRSGYVERTAELCAERAGLLAVAGEGEAAQAAASAAAQAAARAASPAGRVASDEAATAAGDAAQARGGLVQAAAAWTDLGRPLAAARCLLVAAQLAERAGAAGAGEALEQAITAFGAAGVSSARARATAL